MTVITYDRRGRSDGSDTKPSTLRREIEDIDALIDEAGGWALLFGTSSGACLALEEPSRWATTSRILPNGIIGYASTP